MKYTVPKVGTILPAKENEDVENPGSLATQLQRLHWEQAKAQDEAFQESERIREDWLAEGGGWGRWLNEYNSGRMRGPKGVGDPNAPSPTPPRGRVVEVIEAESGGISFDIVDGADPVCEIPEYTKKTPPQHYK